jgi:hypothetical protein
LASKRFYDENHMTRTKIFLGALLACGIGLPCSWAGPITGTFNMNGEITVTATTITWNSEVTPNLANMFTLSAGAGAFATEDGQNEIATLLISSEPVQTTFTPSVLMTFLVSSGLPNLDVSFIYAGNGGSTGCTEAPAVNETCTPTNPGGSPFTFTDDSASTSDAKFVFAGVTSDGLSDWTAIFTSEFNQPYQTVLAGFDTGGSASDSYSATVTITAIPTNAVPEPASFLLGGLGAGVLLVSRKRRRSY